jgi:hypothetical protein
VIGDRAAGGGAGLRLPRPLTPPARRWRRSAPRCAAQVPHLGRRPPFPRTSRRRDRRSTSEGAAPDAAEIAGAGAPSSSPITRAGRRDRPPARATRRVVLYDAHSIRSRIPRLFDGELPHFNIGTNGGASCDPALTAAVEAACDASGSPASPTAASRAAGPPATTAPGDGVHAIQMELACRGYMDDPANRRPGQLADALRPGPRRADARRPRPRPRILPRLRR